MFNIVSLYYYIIDECCCSIKGSFISIHQHQLYDGKGKYGMVIDTNKQAQ